MPKPIDNSSVALAIGESDKRLESTKSQIEDLMKNMDALLTNKNDLKLLEDLLKATKSGLNTAANTAIVTYMNNAAQAMIQKNIERSVALQADLLTSLSRGDDYKYLRDAGYTFSASGDMIVGSRLTYNGLFKVNGLAYEDASYSPVFSGQFISIATKFNPPAMNIDLFGTQHLPNHPSAGQGDIENTEFSASTITNAQENLKNQEEAITKAYEKFKNKTVEVREKYTVNEDLKNDKQEEFTKSKNESLNSFTKFVNDTSSEDIFTMVKNIYGMKGDYSYTDSTTAYNGTRRLKGQINVQTSYGPVPVDVDYGDQKLDVVTKIDPKKIGFEYALAGEGKTFTDNKLREAKRQFADKAASEITDIKKKADANDAEKASKGFLFSVLSGQIGNSRHRGDAFSRSDLGRSDYGKILRAAVSPFTYVGIALTAVDLSIGNIYNLATHRGVARLSLHNGAVVVQNSGTQNFLEDIGAGSGAFVPAPFVFAGTNASNNPATMAHEMGHIEQYYDWDPVTYTAFGIQRFTGSHSDYYPHEWNADARSGQVNYPGPRRDAVRLMIANAITKGDIALAELLLRMLYE